MNYQSKKTVMLGDQISYNGQIGIIVLLRGKSNDITAFDPKDWSSCPGVLIRFENGAVLHLDDSNDPLLMLLKRRPVED
jgi:hypothetical protein